MADIDQRELVHTMQELIRAIRDNSLSSGYSKTKTNAEKFKEQAKDPIKDAADTQRVEKAMKEGTKALKDAFKNQEHYGRDMKLAGSFFQAAVGKLSTKAFDELPKRISKLTQDINLQFQTKADIDKALNRYSEQNIDAAKKLHDKFITLTAGTKKYNETLSMMTKVWGADISELARTKQELIKTGEDLGKAVRKETLAIEQAATNATVASKTGTVLAEILIYAGKQMLDATVASAKFGVEILPLAKDMKFLGMSADELGQIQNKNFQAIQQLKGGFTEFDSIIIKGAVDLAAFTGNLKDGAIIVGDAFRNFRMLSSQAKDQDKFIDETKKVFQFMHETVGTTAQQFQELTSQLMNNTDVQVNMYRLNERQRTQAFQELLQQNALLKTYGLLEPEAQAVVQTFAQIGAQGPKERLKQAAQLQAVGGALGLGRETAQLAAYIRSGDTNNPEAIKLAHIIQQRAQQQYANAKAKGIGAELQQYALTNNLPGVQQILGQRGPIANLGTREGVKSPPPPVLTEEQAKDKAKDDARRKTAVKTVVTISDQIKGVQVILGVIATTLALPTFTGLLKKMFTGGLGKFGSLLGGGAAAEGAAGGAVSVGGIAAAASSVGTLAAVGLTSYGITRLLTDTIPKMLGADQGLGELIGGKVADWFGPKINSPMTFKDYSKDAQVASLLEKYNEDEKKGDENDMGKLMSAMKELVKNLAIADKRDPDKAIEALHRTIKLQHQENKELTQEQTDAVKKTKHVIQTRTTTPTGQTL